MPMKQDIVKGFRFLKIIKERNKKIKYFSFNEKYNYILNIKV